MIDQVSVGSTQPELVLEPHANPIGWYASLPRNWRYLAIATICAVVNNVLLIGLVKAGIGYFAGIWIAYIPMVLFGYALHSVITFQQNPSVRALLRYALVMLANYPLWILSLFVLRGELELPIEAAAPIGTVIAFIGNYLGTHWAILRSVRSAFEGAWGRGRHPLDKKLLVRFLTEYAFQPATAFWRAIELPPLIALGIPMGRGLDLGCGDGKLTGVLLSRIGYRDLIGVDPDPRETDEAKRRCIYSAVHTCGASQIPEPDASFDFAMSNSVLEHIPDLDSVLAETARVLRPNGLFFLTVPQAGFRAQLRGPLMPGISRRAYTAKLDRRLAHLRYPTAAAWQQMLDRHGFVTEDLKFYLDRPEVRRWETLSRLTAGVLSAISGGRLHPIALQRRLGLRQIQNRNVFPLALASVLATLITFGLGKSSTGPQEAHTGCVAIRCRRRSALSAHA